MAYNFIDQNIVSSCLIQGHTDDSFYNPTTNSHTGFAADGNYYSLGVLDSTHAKASWFSEYPNTYRGSQAAFPTAGLVLLSPVALTIINQAVAVAQASALPMWMLFILSDYNALANNFNFALSGFLPQSVCYADGIVSVTYSPDAGNQPYPEPPVSPLLPPYPSPYPNAPAQSNMVVHIDFVKDQVYLDVAMGPPA